MKPTDVVLLLTSAIFKDTESGTKWLRPMMTTTSMADMKGFGFKVRV